MTETMPYAPLPVPVPSSPEGLYFQIVCDPGHERTARELSALPRESRERVWADLAGTKTFKKGSQSNYGAVDTEPVEDGPLEDPQFIQDRLSQLDREIQALPRTTSLQLALNTPFGHDLDFRLSMLKAEEFDASQAARRYQRHFELKVALFGATKVGEIIRLQDLNRNDVESLECGALQLLPKTDRAGRLILVSRYRDFKYQEKENLLRALFYMIMSVFDTPNLKNAEIVLVGYEVGDFVPVDHDLTLQIIRLLRSLPIRVVASHSCYSARPLQQVLDLVVHMVSAFARLRLRSHYGSHQECRYRLMTIGIPVNYLPISMDGALLTENHQQWLKFRRNLEQN